MLRFAPALGILLLATPASSAPPEGPGPFQMRFERAGSELVVRVRNAGRGPTAAARTEFRVERAGRPVAALGRKGRLAPIAAGAEARVPIGDERRLAPGTAVFCVLPRSGVAARLCIREALGEGATR